MKATLVGSRYADRRNMEHLAYRIGVILGDRHSVDLVGPSRVSDRIAGRLQCTAWEEIRVPWLWRILCRDPITMRVARLVAHGRAARPDVLVALGSIGINGLAVAVAARLLGAVGVVRLTHDVFRVYKTKPGFWIKARLLVRNNLLGFLAMRLAHRVLLLHEAQRPDLAAAGVPDHRMRVVPQPLPFAAEELRGEGDIREELGIDREARLILTTMRLDPDKRIDLLLEVMQRVLWAPDGGMCHFVIVGDGKLGKHVADETRVYGSRVHMVGEQPVTRLADYYRAADVYLHLSKGEGLSNCLVEALFFGVPVIANDSGPITRAMISTVSEDPRQIAEAIIRGRVPVDPVPEMLRPEANRKAWLEAVEIPSG